jgi:hypothetical protein
MQSPTSESLNIHVHFRVYVCVHVRFHLRAPVHVHFYVSLFMFMQHGREQELEHKTHGLLIVQILGYSDIGV